MERIAKRITAKNPLIVFMALELGLILSNLII